MMPTLDSLSRELSLTTQQILEIHCRLADSSGLELAVEQELERLFEQRRRIIMALGRIVSRHLLAGGSITWEAGAADTGASPISGTQERRTSEAHRRIREIIEQFGHPGECEDVESLVASFAHIRRLVNQCDRWLDLLPTARRHAMGASVAWLRDLQELNETLDEPLREAQIIGLVSRLSQWSREHRPGWVNGLARGATPDGSSWRADVSYHLDALKTLVEVDDPDTEALWSGLRQAVESDSGDEARWIRLLLARNVDSARIAQGLTGRPDLLDLLGQAGGPQPSTGPDALPPNWPWTAYAQRRDLLVLGGSPNSDTASSLKHAFDLARVTWDPATEARAQLVHARLQRGEFDLVMVVAPLDPKVEELLDAAAAQHSFTAVRVVGALTVASMKHAMEQALPKPSCDAPGIAHRVSHSAT